MMDKCEEIRRNYCSCEHERKCATCDMYDELMTTRKEISLDELEKTIRKLPECNGTWHFGGVEDSKQTVINAICKAIKAYLESEVADE